MHQEIRNAGEDQPIGCERQSWLPLALNSLQHGHKSVESWVMGLRLQCCISPIFPGVSTLSNATLSLLKVVWVNLDLI